MDKAILPKFEEFAAEIEAYIRSIAGDPTNNKVECNKTFQVKELSKHRVVEMVIRVKAPLPKA